MRPAPIVAITPGDGRPLGPWITALADAGLRTLLVREPDADAATLRATTAVALAAGLQVILHAKHPDARALAATHHLGLHLPSGGDPSDRAGLRGPIGVSCHDVTEVDAALDAGADYTFLGPVFKPTSKPLDPRGALGPAAFLTLAAERPVWALGGMNATRWAVLARGGAAGAAVLGDLFGAESPEQAAERLAAFLAVGAAHTEPGPDGSVRDVPAPSQAP